MLKQVTFSIIALLILSITQAQEHYPQNFMPSGSVERLIQSNDTLFGVGGFHMNGYKVGSMFSYNGTQRDEIDINTPYFDSGVIHEAIPDNNGGWYVSTSNCRYNGVAYHGVLHIKNDKTIDTDFLLTQNQGLNGHVNALFFHNGILYVGGNFQNFPNFNRSHLIAYNTLTNQFEQGFNAGFNWQNSQFVNSILVRNNELIIGGSFTGSQPASCLARFNRLTGALIQNYNANAEVRQMYLESNLLYVGGDFSSVLGQNRKGMAVINLSTNSLMLSPNFDGLNNLVHDFKIDGSNIYVCGRFTTINGQSKHSLAKLNRHTWFIDQNFNVNIDANVLISALTIQGSQLMIAGYFNEINGSQRKKLAQVNINTGVLHSWKPDAYGDVKKLYNYNGNPFIIGNINQLNYEVRNSFFALKLPERKIIPINFNVNNTNIRFRDIAKHGNTLFFCGSFTNAIINGTQVSQLFAYNIQTGQVQNIGNFGGVANQFITRLLVHDDKLYVSGIFSQVNGLPRNRIAAFKLSDYSLDDWSPELSSFAIIRKMAIYNNKLYMCGRIDQENPFRFDVIAAFSLADASYLGGLYRHQGSGTHYKGDDFIIHNNSIYLAGSHRLSLYPIIKSAIIKLNDSFEIDTNFYGSTPIFGDADVSISEINGNLIVLHPINDGITNRYLYFHNPLSGDTISRLEINFKGDFYTSEPYMPYSYIYNNNMLYIGGNWDRVNGNAVRGLAIIDGREVPFPDLSTHVDEIPEVINESLVIFPNPAQDFIQIQSEVPLDIIELFDLQGRKLKSCVPNQENVIQVSDLNPGVYLMKCTQGKNIFSRKIIIQ